jgi:hypothetical protein
MGLKAGWQSPSNGFKGRVAKPFNLVDLSIVLNSVMEETVL